MRMFLLIILLFIPLTANALCDNNDPDNCCPGRYNLNGDCEQCPGSTTEAPQGYYCEGGTAQPTPCPAPFSSSFAGAAQIGECFARLTCDNDSGIEAGVPYTTESSNYQLIPIVNEAFAPSTTFQYHLEVPSAGFSCESNSNNCANFDKSPQSLNCTPSYDTVTWNNNSNNWYVANCKCNTDYASIQDKNCTGPQQYVAIEDQTGVTHVGDPIHFETTPESYYCNSCIADSGNDIYYADINATESNCDKNVSGGKVCACTKLTDKGFYRTGSCGANQNWGAQSDICLAQVCPLPGQTTLTLGPTDPDDCTYTDQTQFCDAKGCFTLNPTEWTFH